MISAVVAALAAIAMMMPVASSAQAAPQIADANAVAGAAAGSATSAAPIADTSADGVQQVAKTHKPQVEQQSFSAPAVVASNGGDASGDASTNGSGNGGESDDNAIDPYSLAAEPRSRSAEPRQGSGSGSSAAPASPSAPQPVTVSAELSGLATVGVTWKQQDMKDVDKAPTYQLRYFRDNAWSNWQTIPSVDDDFGKMGVSPSYYVGDATKVEAQLTPVAGQTLTEAKLVTIDSGYSAVGDAQTSAYRSESKADTTDKASVDDTYPVDEAGAVRSDNAASESDSTRTATVGWPASNPATAKSAVTARSATSEHVLSATSATLTSGKSDSADSATGPTPTVRTAAAVTATGRIHTREEWWVPGNPAMTWRPKRDGHWKGAIVHHTVDRNDYTQAEVPAMINGIYLFHNTQRGWGDIGYQLIVDRFGGIWEGRDEGVANQVVPASQVEGAQAVGFNRDTFGVAMLGSYHLDVPPTDAQIESTAAAIAWEFKALGIPSPFGTFQFQGTQQRVTGHGDPSHYIGGDLNHTLCPGQQVWDRMEIIRARVLGYMIRPSGMPAVNVPNGAYYINSVAKDSSSIEIPADATADGVRTELHSATGKANQQFTFTRQPDGSYEIKNVATGKALDVADARAWNNAEVRQWTPDGTAAQHWFIRDSGSGYYLQSALGDYVLDLSGGNTADGALAALYSPNGSSAQKFGLASVNAVLPIDKDVRIESVAQSGMVLDIAGGSTANRAALRLYSWNGTDAQRYRLKLVGNNVYVIVNVRSNKVIDVPGNRTYNKVQLQQYADNGSAAQHWMARTSSDSSVSFFGVVSGKSFDLPGGSTALRTPIQLYTGNGTPAQRWKVVG